MYAKIVEACRFLLQNYPAAQEAKDYIDSRLSKESQERFQFGYFPNVKNLPAIIDIVGEEELRNTGLFYTRNIEDSLFPRHVPTCYFEDYPIVMPFRNAYGEPVALVGRTILSEEERKTKKISSKYKNTQKTTEFKKGNLLFGLYENNQYILEKDSVFVVEGQFDVIKAGETGLKNIVGLGTNNMTNYQFSVISRYSNNIFLLLDNDEEGKKGRQRITKEFEQFANIRNFYLPDAYKDIDEYITKENISKYEDMSFVVKE
jgi:DNA primase catalytic core